MSFTAAVLTVSDSVHEGTRQDRSGPAVRQRLESAGWRVPRLDVLPDEPGQIAAHLTNLADSGEVSAIFTTGGTGLAARDRTPEATRQVIEREIPGIGEKMRAAGRTKTPLADLSRGLAGTRGRTVIVNLPGSPKGAVESLDAILDIVPHVVDLLCGRTDHPAGLQRD
ncbi:MAG: MogA/MoaB family molybdenum cofactor biosynthesis protein [Bryobacterales bacterium]|nr:MogA/MoaB family molybdenum cofactor biosynthesis protein [Bryobacterales bacterium]